MSQPGLFSVRRTRETLGSVVNQSGLPIPSASTIRKRSSSSDLKPASRPAQTLVYSKLLFYRPRRPRSFHSATLRKQQHVCKRKHQPPESSAPQHPHASNTATEQHLLTFAPVEQCADSAPVLLHPTPCTGWKGCGSKAAGN